MLKSIKLYNGYEMPVIGLGTWLSEPGEVKVAVENALNLGYKHFDCAWAYFNEQEIGDTISKQIKSNKIKREDIFVTSKLWNAFHRPELVHVGFEETLNNLKLDYLDLFLIHWPISIKPGNKIPKAEDFAKEIENVDLVDTWKELEKLVDSGKVRSIGLSNFNIKQIQSILDNCRIKPAVLQVEVHVYFPNKKLVDFCLKKDIQVTAYSPLGGSSARPGAVQDEKRPSADPAVLTIAKKRNATPSQILLSYIMHRNLVCIPKSVSSARLEENLKAVNVELSPEELETLNNLQCNNRMCNPLIFKLHKDYPFNED